MPETVQSLLRKSREYFDSKGISEGKRSSEMLLAHVLQCERIDLYLRFEQPLSEDELERYREVVRRRSKGEPVQYIIGETEFYSLPFHVNPAVLIPRPETEHLVDHILELTRDIDATPSILDIGTGSGNIAVSLAKNLPATDITAIDSSNEALSVARENARRNGVENEIEFRLFNFLENEPAELPGPFDIIVSNPPYIPAEDIEHVQKEVRDFEPRKATTDAADGLTFYRRIAETAPVLLKSDGYILCEIGFGQAKEVSTLFQSSAMTVVQIIRDYAGIERIVVARLQPT